MPTTAAAKLRELLQRGTVVSPGIYDGLGARICLEQGFDTLYMVSGVRYTNRRREPGQQ